MSGGGGGGKQGAVLEVEYLASVDRSDCLALANELVDIYCQARRPPPSLPSAGYGRWGGRVSASGSRQGVVSSRLFEEQGPHGS